MKKIYIEKHNKSSAGSLLSTLSSPSAVASTFRASGGSMHSPVSSSTLVVALMAFLLGCIAATSTVLWNVNMSTLTGESSSSTSHQLASFCHTSSASSEQASSVVDPAAPIDIDVRALEVNQATTLDSEMDVHGILRNLKVLVVIVAFDFAQIPHLEEVLDSYHDVCVSGATVDVVIHATVAYPVSLIDLWNTRFSCTQFNIKIALSNKSLRLHLVDRHRTVFYDHIDEYDLFIYTEDDIRVRPTTVATYAYHTKQVEEILKKDPSSMHKPSDFNVGVVRYEYNYPANVIIDDNTRHATQNVTRVYWEHSGFERPVVPNAAIQAPQEPLAKEGYITMRNHHQGMYLATRDLLLAWKERDKCHFDVVTNRPGKGSQPTEGTQRVWMSSQQLYGGRHCNVQQVLPQESFGALTVLHLPNKNYRRVGKYRNRKFSDGTEVFEQPHESLLSAMEFHIGTSAAIPKKPQFPYRGITMVDEVTEPRDRTPLLQRRIEEYEAYVQRGGVLSEEDQTKLDLVENF